MTGTVFIRLIATANFVSSDFWSRCQSRATNNQINTVAHKSYNPVDS